MRPNHGSGAEMSKLPPVDQPGNSAAEAPQPGTPPLSESCLAEAADLQVRRLVTRYALTRTVALVIAEHAFGFRRHG
jgi:hypothetical protein